MGTIYKEYTKELDHAVEQVCSPLYRETFEKVFNEQPDSLSIEQRALLSMYPNTITWYQGDRREEIVQRIRHDNLEWFHTWLSEHISGRPPYLKRKNYTSNMMLHLQNLLFRIDHGDIVTEDETRTILKKIAETTANILKTIRESINTTTDQSPIFLIQELLAILFYLTLDAEIVLYLKELQLVELMNGLIERYKNDQEIQIQAYRILAAVMVESDIKKLHNSQRIATLFIHVIDSTIDGGDPYVDRLHNTLQSLRVLAQHDEIREELIKQDGQSRFLRCAMENHFNPLKAKLPALDILLALAFNKDFASTLKNNTDFMNHLRILTSSHEEKLQRVATALIWKLEKESEISIQQAKEQTSITLPSQSSKKQYDIMISYSHSDKELCDRLLEALEKDQYHVWIDSQLMHGATFDAMAEAIENAEFVFICMSDAYKQSPFCKMEASYAVKRRCNIIPLVMTSNYKADGWLGVLTSALIYVDFPKVGFEKAYQALKKQVQLIRTSEENSTVAKQDQVQHNPLSIIDSVSKPVLTSLKPREPRPVVEYPHCIDNWTEEHVKSFLLDKQLDVLLPAFEGMNGHLLHRVCLMCKTNQQAMFCALKDETEKSQHGTLLKLKDYLTFLEEIKIYIPINISNSLDSTSAVCNLM